MLKNLLPTRGIKRQYAQPPNDNDQHSSPLFSSGLGENKLVEEFCFRHEKTLGEDSVRLVIMAEAERRLLFDSETVRPIGCSDAPITSPISSCGRFQFLKHRDDIATIAQMLFGSVTSVKNDSFKMHSLSDGQHLMVSRIISVPKFSKPSNSDYKVNVGSLSSMESGSPHSTHQSILGTRERFHRNSQSIDPPEGFTRLRNSSLQMDIDEGNMDWLRAFSPSRISVNRRMQLSFRGNLYDEGNCGDHSNRSRLSSFSSYADEEYRKLGIGVLFREEERQFLLCHIPLVEIEILKVEEIMIKASRSHFLQIIFEAWLEMMRNVCLLYNSYRFRSPVWLSLMNDKQYTSTAHNFCSNLYSLIYKYDLKSTRFFVSTLLSCVLMNHLAWVASVAPSERCEDLRRSLLLGKIGNWDSHRHPYNAQLAQYMEVSGCVGGATRFARTVIIGDDMKLVTHLLYILTYFVRCSSIKFNVKRAHSWDCQPAARTFTSTESFKEDLIDGTIDAVADNDEDESLWFISSRDNQIFHRETSSIDKFLAWSMLAGPCQSYCPYFVISGLSLTTIDIQETYCAMLSHVKNSESEIIITQSPASSASSMVSDSVPIKPTVVVFADASDYTVKIVSGDDTSVEESQMISPCDAIVSMLEQFGDLYRLGAAPTLLLSFIEDSLGDILTRSLTLVELLEGAKADAVDGSQISTITADRAVNIIGCDYSDLRLIVNVAAVYYPSVLQSVI